MASEILTPLQVWEDFNIEHQPEIELIGEYKDGNISITRFYLYGRSVDNEKVKIYCALSRDISLNKQPGIFVVQDFMDGADETFITYLAKRGYSAITFDMAGDESDKGNRTKYPKSISFANFVNSEKGLRQITGSIKQSCWYEWGVTARYVLDYFSSLDFIDSIGAIGAGDASTVLWHLSTDTSLFKCVGFILNAGWLAYKGRFKFSGILDADFSDEDLKYIAGIEPQTYAPHVKCPTIMLVPTNSDKFDCDRAYDTFVRLNQSVYALIDYSVKYRNSVSSEVVTSAELFFDKYLKNKNSIYLPKRIEISGEIEDGKLSVTVSPDKKDLKELVLYVAEGVINPSVRAWHQEKYVQETEDGSYVFEFTPYCNSGNVVFFARATYKNGASIASAIINKRFSLQESSLKYKSNVIYSSREELAESIFTSAKESEFTPMGLNLESENTVQYKIGPANVGGVYCTNGILTFNVGTNRYRPSEDATCMLDVYVKEDSILTVKLITNFFNERKEYIASAKVRGGKVWHNVKLTRQEFKTIEGQPLRTFEEIEALEINADGEYLINNILWV